MNIKYIYQYIKTIILIAMVFNYMQSKAQEIGYVTGVTKQGIEPATFHPLYGFTIGANINKYLGIETALFYSQRSIRNTIQSDYITFLAMPKVGYFGKKAAIYFAPGIALNPTLDHTNPENHTYLSTIQSIGGQINVIPELILDIKIGYDFGLTGAYTQNGYYQKYAGGIIFLGLKYVIKKCP